MAAHYYLNLGLNWNSPTIGSLWTTDPSQDRFLQYALAAASGAPAWFLFEPGDELSVQLWDLSNDAPLLRSAELSLGLGALDAAPGGVETSLDPLAVLDLQQHATVQTKVVGDRTNEYVQFPSAAWAYEHAPYAGPWGPCRGKASALGPVRFKARTQFELSLRLAASPDPASGSSEAQVYVSDPEVIVGSRG